MTKLDECLQKVDALSRRMDALGRSDAGPKTGTLRAEWTHDYTDKYGAGDFDYLVTIKYSIDVSGEPSKIDLVGKKDMTPDQLKSAMAAAEKSVRRYLASSAGVQAMVEAVLEKIG